MTNSMARATGTKCATCSSSSSSHASASSNRVVAGGAILLTSALWLVLFRLYEGQRSLFLPRLSSTTLPCRLGDGTTENDFDEIDRAWCPNATCHSDSRMLCVPCRRRFLIILATGRTGSTTLTWMLDGLPGVRVAGENAGTANKMMATINDLLFRAPAYTGNNVAWKREVVPEGGWACPVQSMLATINPPPPPPKPPTSRWGRRGNDDDHGWYGDDSRTILGFKEIRWVKGDETPEPML